MKDETIQIPEGFARRSLGALPEAEHGALLAALNESASARGMRLRPGVPLDKVRTALPGSYLPVPWARDAFYIDADSTAGSHVLHAAGAYYLQEPSAMAAAAALDIQPGQRVLDLCAAPGGKSTQIAGLLGGGGVLVSNEIVPGRAKILSQNIERMGVRNGIVTNEFPDRLAARWQGWFDRVLVDAPCSGEGMFRREPHSRAEWNEQSPDGCAARQRAILRNAAELVRPGGVLVYSTCTFNTMENEETVQAFLMEHKDFSAEDFALPGVGASIDGCLRLWPHRVAGEGHFVARLRRAGAEERELERGATVALSQVDALFGQAAAPGILQTSGTKLWLLPVDMPPLAGIRVLRSGLALGEARGKVFVPDHAAALAFAPEDFAQAFPVSLSDAVEYLRGEALAGSGHPAGWGPVCWEGLSLGWAKCADGVLKNHLPKGLRVRR